MTGDATNDSNAPAGSTISISVYHVDAMGSRLVKPIAEHRSWAPASSLTYPPCRCGTCSQTEH